METAPSLPLRYVRLVLGLACFAAGTTLTLWAELGLSPWDVLHDGLRLNTPLTFGTATIVVGAALILVSLIGGVRPGPGTLANMVLIGVFVDLFLASGLGDGIGNEHVALRAATTLAGVAVIGLGSALYIGAELGAGPRDSLMVTVATRGKMRVGIARTITEGSALIAGILLGGKVGVGTILFVVTIGPAVDIAFRIFRMDSSGHRDRPLSEAPEQIATIP
ncbi:MAG: YczE/YyaS/YitT family protein [Actinomycetota bacterium]